MVACALLLFLVAEIVAGIMFILDEDVPMRRLALAARSCRSSKRAISTHAYKEEQITSSYTSFFCIAKLYVLLFAIGQMMMIRG